MASMQKMQKLQPRIKMLQEKYKNDKETLNREMMALYKENKVNPAAGCFPLLVQLPVFILLYRVLTQYDFSGVSFLGIQLDGSVLSTVAQAVGLAMEKDQLGIMSVGYAVMANPAGLMNIGIYLANTLLLAGIGFLTWYQQQLSSTGNPQMAMMNWFMPLFLTFICLSLPGGVLLYWGVSSLLGVIQQIVMSKKTAVEMQKKPTLFKDRPSKSGE
jgi:YidC/Oxa1 family membrane protein insertase